MSVPIDAGRAAEGLLVTATVGNGLLAGLFLGFSCAVLPGLTRVDDGAFVDTFRNVNRAIRNPVFGLVLVATPVATVAGAAATVLDGREGAAWALAGLAGTAAMLAVTFARNVPLNEVLDRAPTAGPGELRAARVAFERPWSRWNAVRTVAGVLATACLALAI